MMHGIILTAQSTDLSGITNLIGTLGFPIVACFYMAKINREQAKAHKEEMQNMTEAINSLKLAINTLVSKFSK